MSTSFDAKNDFLLPMQIFAQRLLGNDGGHFDDVEQARKFKSNFVSGNSDLSNIDSGKNLKTRAVLEDTVNTCLQVQAGLQLMAINNVWPGNDKIVRARIVDTDPRELTLVQSVLNVVHEKYLQKVTTGKQPEFETFQMMPYSRTVGFMAIIDAKNKLKQAGQEDAVAVLDDYVSTEPGVETEYSYEQAAQNFFRLVTKNEARITGAPKL